MKISTVSNYFYTNKNTPIIKNEAKPKTNLYTNNIEYTPLYYPVSFSGGDSLSLKATKENLDKIPNAYPTDIRKDIERTLEAGNPENKTLIDIHKDKYSLLNECESLKEAKELYPEFNGVLSDNQVIYSGGSFIDEVKEGKVRGFDPDIDVSLQLLQLYWGEGFSLKTLKDDYADKNVHYTFQKLGIPRVNNVYGQYLKLSDKEYNERYTREMAERAAEIERKRIEKAEGVYIQRGPLSDEQKAKISESLKLFYANNPDKVYDMSKRQIEFFENNPEEKEKLSQVMIRAWNYKEADSIKKKLAKVMNKASLSDNDISESINLNSPQHKAFKNFWQKNGWAKKTMSECISKSWERQNHLSNIGLIYEPLYSIKVFPDYAKDFIVKKNPGSELLDFNYIIMDPRDEKRPGKKNIFSREQLKKLSMDDTNYIAITYNIVPRMVITEIAKNNGGKYNEKTADLLSQYAIINNKYPKYDPSLKENHIFDIYMDFIDMCIKQNNTVAIKQINKSLDEAAKTVHSTLIEQPAKIRTWDKFYKKVSEDFRKVIDIYAEYYKKKKS